MAVVQNVRKIYIANISRHAREKDIGRLFEEAGRIASLEHKGNFGFIEYETDRAAEDSIRRFHDHDFMGKQLIVKPYRYRGGDFRYNPDAAPNPAKFRGPRSTSYRLYITGLDDSTSWQDVKDFARTGGRSVCYTDVYTRKNNKEGVIEYYKREDFEYALRYLDRARLNGCRVRVFDRQPGGDDSGDNKYRNNDRGQRSRSRGQRSRSRDRNSRNDRDNRDNGYNYGAGRNRSNRMNNNNRDNGNYGGRNRDSYRDSYRNRDTGRDTYRNNGRRENKYEDKRDFKYENNMKAGRSRSRSPRREPSRTPPQRNKIITNPSKSPLSNPKVNDHEINDHKTHTNEINNHKGRIDEKPRVSRSRSKSPLRKSPLRSPPNYHNGRRQRSHSPVNHKRSVSRSKSPH